MSHQINTITNGSLTVHSDLVSAAAKADEVADEIDERRLAEVMRLVPLGAGMVAGAAVAMLVMGYLMIYLLVFIPRGVVG